MTTMRAKLRELLRRPEMIVAPGSYDGIGARIIERTGFDAVYMTGAGTAAALGFPDYGLITMSEMVANARRIAASIKVPLIADADTGYGNELNVWRTVQEYEQAGVAGIHIEDQDFPKKCGHLENKKVIPLDDYLAKIRAAAAAKTDPDFLLIARTDCRAALGFEQAVVRANAALEAGADMAFVEAPQTAEEVAAVPRLVKGPCLLNLVWAGVTPLVPFTEAERMGYRVTIVPGMLIKEAIGAFESALGALKAQGAHPKTATDLAPAGMFARVGADVWDARRTEFLQAARPLHAAE